MSKVFLAAALLSSILAVSGCVGGLPNIGALGSALGGQSNGGGQAYPYDYGAGGGYAQPSQPYYQPQSQVYSGNPGAYAYQSSQVPQATGGYTAPPAGRWIDRRQQRQENRIQQGLASGQLTPDEANRLRTQQGRIGGAEGRMRADGNLSPQERGRLNAMQNRSSQDIYRLRHNGVQPGPTAQSGPTGPAQSMGQLRPAGQPRATMQPRTATQRRTTNQPRQTRPPNGSAI
jgi:hypothetical protein